MVLQGNVVVLLSFLFGILLTYGGSGFTLHFGTGRTPLNGRGVIMNDSIIASTVS